MDCFHQWIAFIDLDEFIVLKKHNCIMDLLATVNNSAAGLALNWYMFDFNGEIEYRPAPLTKRFQRREKNVNQHIKTISRASKIVGVDQCHYQLYEGGGFAVDTDGKKL